MKTLRKKPIQVYVEPNLDALLELLSKKRGTSKAAIIREGLSKFLNDMPVEDDPAMGLVGLGRSGRSDLSVKHDHYVVRHASSPRK